MRLAVRAITIAAALLAVACGSAEEEQLDNAGDAKLAAAADRSAREKTVRMAFKMDIDAGKESMSATGTGTTTVDSSRGRLQMRLRTPDTPRFDFDAVMRGDVIWMRSEQLRGALPDGKQWMRVSDSTMAPRTMTFSEFIELLRASEGVKVVGAERIRGRRTTHYSARVSVKELIDRSPPESAARFEKSFGSAEGELPVDAWVGEDELLWRIRLAFDGDDIERVEGAEAEFVVDILDYGAKLDAAPPPARLVADESEVDTK